MTEPRSSGRVSSLVMLGLVALTWAVIGFLLWLGYQACRGT